MIKAEYGEVNIKGTRATTMADFICVIRAIKDMLDKEMSEEEVRQEIEFCRSLAFKSDEEIKEETEKNRARIEQLEAEIELERIGRRYEH